MPTTTTCPPRPTALPVKPELIPEELKALPHWVVWKLEQRGSNWTKVPYQPNNCKAQSTNPATWSSFGEVINVVNRFDGIGFVFRADGPHVGVDLDDCLDGDGKLSPWAAEIVGKFDTYTEVSPSGTGLKLFCCGTLAADLLHGKGTGRRKGPIEVYRSGRYFTVTGHRWQDSPGTIADCTEALGELLREITKPTSKPAAKPSPRPEPSSNGHAPTELPCAKLDAFLENLPEFKRRFEGDRNGLRDETDSGLELSLVHYAVQAGWTDGEIVALLRERARRYDPDRLDKLQRDDYLRRTIAKARENVDRQTLEGASKPSGSISVWLAENRTDTANARRLAAAFGADLRYCDPWDGKWLHWDGKRWAIDQQRTIDSLAKKLAGELWQDVQQATDRQADAKLVQELIRYAKASNGANGVRNTIAMLRSEPGIAILPKALDRNPWLLNVENGTLDLQTGKLRPHDRADYITKLAPVLFDPDADCPHWRKFLADIFAGNAALMGFMRRLMGYTLTGRVAEHVLPVFHGWGSNGKSTLCTAFLDLLGEDYGIQGASDLLLVKKGEAHPTERADLHGKRLVACIETDDGRRLAEGLLKQITGGDKIRARRMREDFWEFAATHKIWLACNHKPVIRGTDHGIWRRVKLVPFSVVIADKDQDKELGDKLALERSGILNWALLGCIQWQAEGLNDPPEVKAATGDYRSEMDVLGGFLAERCHIDPAAYVGATDLYRAYRAWAETAGEHAVNQTQFGSQLTERGYVAKKHYSGTVRRLGLGLLDTSHRPDPDSPDSPDSS
jgi:putative DNA primase/helicase